MAMRSLNNKPVDDMGGTKNPGDNSSETLIYQMVYASSALHRWEAGEREVLVLEGRRRNAAVGITGVLVWHEGCFLQVLEGPPREVKALFGRIRADARHFTVTLLWEGFVATRDFPDSPMAFYEGHQAEARFTPAFRRFAADKFPRQVESSSPAYPFTELLLKSTG